MTQPLIAPTPTRLGEEQLCLDRLIDLRVAVASH